MAAAHFFWFESIEVRKETRVLMKGLGWGGGGWLVAGGLFALAWGEGCAMRGGGLGKARCLFLKRFVVILLENGLRNRRNTLAMLNVVVTNFHWIWPNERIVASE